MAGELKQSAVTLFNNPVLSDVKIKQVSNGSTREYSGHRAVLCTQSKFFLKAFTGNFKEASSNEIELHDDDPEAFEFALEYMYTIDYNRAKVRELSQHDTAKCAITSMRIFEIADKYDILRLRSSALDEFSTCLRSDIDKGCPALKAVIQDYYTSHTPVGSDLGLRITLNVFEDKREFMRFKDFKSIMKSKVGFAADMALLGQDKSLFSFMSTCCTHCGIVTAYQPGCFDPTEITFFCHDCGTHQGLGGDIVID